MKQALSRIIPALEVILLGTTGVLAFLWIRDPSGPYEPWLALAAACSAVLEYTRRQVTKKDEPTLVALSEKIEKALDDLRHVASRSPPNLARQAPGHLVALGKPSESGVNEYLPLVRLRHQIEGQVLDYARAKGVDTNGRTPIQVAALLPIPETFRHATEKFLKVTEDLVHLAGPMKQWAEQHGETVHNVLTYFLDSSGAPQNAR